MAATIGPIVDILAVITAIPVKLPVIAVIGAGILAGTFINEKAQTAKKEWID